MKICISLSFIFLSVNIFAQKITFSDTIPLTINKQNTIFIKAIFNETDTLNLNFDTGTTELVLTNDVIKNKLKSTIKLYSKIYNLKIGNNIYKTKIYDAVLSGHGTDGRFGWDLFKDKIIELNYDKNLMIIHNDLPKDMSNSSKYEKLKMKFFKDLFLVSAKIKQRNITIEDLFLFDTGFQRTVLLDNDLLKESKFPTEKMNVIKKVIMKGAQGNEFPVVTSNLELLKIGKYKLKNVPIQQITSNKPLKDKNIHILGNEVLKRFNVVLDFKSNAVYLSKNKLFNCKYIDQEKSGS